MQCNPFRILLLEDNADHAMLIQLALASANVEVVHLPSAELARDYLSTANRCLALMLVDINLTDQSGVHFLQWVKLQDQHRLTPVVMLSTSDNPLDVAQSFRWGASGYFTKPVGQAALKAKLEVLLAYWRGASLLPGVACADS